MGNSKTFIYTIFQKEGYHSFPEAATLPSLATGDKFDVSHLALSHFHYFYFKVWVEVKSSNREIEFIQLNRWLKEQYGAEPLDFGSNSCEMIAEKLLAVIKSRYLDVDIRVDVSEDNINGAYLEYQSK